ncbi:MAG: sigma-70 family RNA polymerase sigma factor [Planctomycetota bacterium]
MKNADETSLTLLANLRLEDPQAWNTLVQIYGPLVYSWCRNAGIQPNDGSDISQAVFSTVHRKISTFDPDQKSSGAFRSWLWGITRLKILEFYRLHARLEKATGGTSFQKRLEQIEGETDEPESIEGMTPQELLVRSALKVLKESVEPSTWQCFWRMTVDGHSAKEIGADLSMTTKAVRQAKFRFTKMLREQLGDDFPDTLV